MLLVTNENMGLCEVTRNRGGSFFTLTSQNLKYFSQMDDGTDAREIFEGKHLPLKKGYIGVVNRSQRDIDERKGIMDAMQKEKDFLRNSPYK